MNSLCALMILCAAAVQGDPCPGSFGVLYQPAFCLDKALREPVRPYVPQAGDIILESDDRLTWGIGHRLAKSGHPHHSMIVFCKPEGGFAILEAGGNPDTPSKVSTADLFRILEWEEAKTGRKERRIWIRQRKVPLTPEQSEALTNFALEVQGRRFARAKLLVLMTPIRAKGPIRTAWLGKPNYDKNSYFCAEMVVTAMAATGIIDAEFARPGASFPHDLFMGGSRNSWVDRGLRSLNECWAPPARWTNRACTVGSEIAEP
jgi:hypothetical protein